MTDKMLDLKPELVLRLLSSVDLALLPKKYRDQVKTLQKRAGELSASAFWLHASTADRDNGQLLSEWTFHSEILSSPYISQSRAISVKLTGSISTTISPLEVHLELYRKLDEDLDVEVWSIGSAAKVFAQDPSPATLSSYITRVSALPLSRLGETRYDLPWPLNAVNNDLREGVDGAELARCAEAGMLGTFDDWLAAERRWRSKAVESGDFLSWNNGFYLSRDLNVFGPPPINRISIRTAGQMEISQLLDVVRQLKVGPKRETLLWLIMSSLRTDIASVEQGHVQQILDVYFDSGALDLPLTARRTRLFGLGSSIWSDERVAALAHRYGLEGQKVRARLVDILAAFSVYPTYRGLLAHVRTPINPAGLNQPSLQPSPEAFVVRESDPLPVRAGVVLLQLRFNKLDNLNIERASADLVARPGALSDAARLLKKREPGDKVRQDFAYQLAKQVRIAGNEPAGVLLDTLKTNVSAAPTAVADSDVAQTLGLPCLVSHSRNL